MFAKCAIVVLMRWNFFIGFFDSTLSGVNPPKPWRRLGIISISALTFFLASFSIAEAALLDQVNQAYRAVHGRNPTVSDWQYWAGRVQRGEKTTYNELVGAIAYQKVNGRGSSVTAAPSGTAAPAAGSFKTTASLYPSPHGPNFLPDGTLIKSAAGGDTYYVKGAKRSYIVPSILNRWLKEAHFFNHSVVVTLSVNDFARYAPTNAKNPTFIGKVLQAPNGTQYYIDDKYRKRPLSASVRSALKFPTGNRYPVGSALLSEFPTGPAVKSTLQPGGMIIYDGPYHGGRIWRLEEGAGGKIMKRLYLGDRFYEAEYYPDENQRVGVSAAELAKYPRGANIGTYPDGWVVSINGAVSVIQDGKLRRITSPKILSALGYKKSNIQTAFTNFVSKLPRGNNIGAFKTVVDGNAQAGGAAPAASVSATSGLTRIRPSVRAVIAQINPTYREVFDKEITASENTFWADYVHSGEVNTVNHLKDAMQDTKRSGKKPGKTCRTCVLETDQLMNKWFPYLFYYTWQQEPSGDDKDYWRGQAEAGVRNTIQKLDAGIQWLKQNEDKTSK